MVCPLAANMRIAIKRMKLESLNVTFYVIFLTIGL